ncbi:MAG: SDR family NAD(P)-dependent oxidoreductase [Saprospiraceae bacterium]|nr:SDR family NAD(P)-dependent oxidoreductase [Saprospiraceae bacterium]
MNTGIFAGKVALITGSSMGIGRAIATALAQEGARVVLNGRGREKLAATEREFLTRGFEVMAVPADIRFSIHCKKLLRETIRRFGRIDMLINNAGVSSRGPVEEMANSNIKILIDTNYTGTAYLTKYAIPYLRKTKGNLIFINSVGGFRGMPYNSAYTASKAAQAALADALRIELFDSGIHVGIAYVGYTENEPEKKILDTDGHWIYLPKRTNVQLATRESVAKQILKMIRDRTFKVTLTPLGAFTAFMIRYLPNLSEWLLRLNREKINRDFTTIGGSKVEVQQDSGRKEAATAHPVK